MPNYRPISRESHARFHWHKTNNLKFIENQGYISIFLEELHHTISTLPIAFIPREFDQSTNQPSAFELVALTALTPNKNLFVTPDGKWLGGYRPAAVRGYPFKLLEEPGKNRLVLCFDQDSGLITESDEHNSESFFNDEGELSDTLKKTVTFLQMCERSRQATQAAVNLLNEHALIQPWQLQISSGDGDATQVKGLYRIDEKALNSLPADALKDLQMNHSLAIAYAQLYSQPRISGFGRLQELHAKLQQADNAMSEEEVESYFEGKDDTLSFNF